MKRIEYSKEQEEFLKEHGKEYDIWELTEIFNKKFGTTKGTEALKSKMYNMGCRYKRFRPALKNRDWNKDTEIMLSIC